MIPKSSKLKIIEVPGVFEIPVTIKKNIKRYDAFIALGCVIKGQTPHFDFISQASINAIMNLSIEYCNMWNYLPRAASLASSILKKYGTSVSALKLIPSSRGVFEIYNDKNLIFSKKDEGRFPEESEVLNTLDNFD